MDRLPDAKRFLVLMGVLKGLLLMLAGGGNEAGFLESSSGSQDFMESARRYLSQKVWIEENGQDFVIEDDFGRGPLAGGRAEYFASIHGEIWRVRLEKTWLNGWRITESQRLDSPETWICNLLERKETNEKTDNTDDDPDPDTDHGVLQPEWNCGEKRRSP